ncbi:MAK10-like protein [Tanacetum coccineum]
MGGKNHILTLGDYSKPSHEGYMNTIELPVGNNVVPLRSDTIQLVQNGCSFYGLRSEDPNQHLKDFLKLMDSLNLNSANRERTHMHLFQFSLRDQASNCLERLLAGSITTWEDLTTRFLPQFFPPGRIAKLRNDILMFQQHQGESLLEAWTRFKDLLQKVPHHGIDLWLQFQIFYDHVNPVTRRTIDQLVGGKLRDKNAKESWALLEDLALYDNESWNNPRDFAKPVKEISLPQDVPSTSDHRLIELENQIWSGPHDTQYCMENPKQAFVEYTYSSNNEVGNRKFTTNQGPRNFKEATDTWKDKPNFKWEQNQTFTSLQNGSISTRSSNYQMKLEKALIDFNSHQEKRQSSLRTQLGQQQDNMISKINLLWKTISKKLDDTPIHNTLGRPKAQMNFTSTNYHIKEELQGKGIKIPSKLLFLKYLSRSSLAELSKNPSRSMPSQYVPSNQTNLKMTNRKEKIEKKGATRKTSTPPHPHHMIHRFHLSRKSEEEFEEETDEETKKEEEGDPKHFDTFPTLNELRYHEWLLKSPWPLWVKAKIETEDVNNVGTKEETFKPQEKLQFHKESYGVKSFIGNFTYKCDFMVLKDTTSVIDHYLGSVVFGKPFVEATRLIYNKEEGTVTFERDKEKIIFKMPHKMNMFKHIDFADISSDCIPSFIVKGDDDNCKKTHYSDSLDFGPEYKYDKYVCRGIRSLMVVKAIRKNKGEVI